MERTANHKYEMEYPANIELMSVTLDVLKLSGWLNANARCRVEKRA